MPRLLSPVLRLMSATRATACATTAILAFAAAAATPQDLLGGYAAQAGRPGDPVQGRQLFTLRHGQAWSCATCHGERPVSSGRHASTAKPIEALAPAAQPTRFTDAAKTEKWFRRNCNDVLSRACTPAEKADVLAWLLTLTP